MSTDANARSLGLTIRNCLSRLWLVILAACTGPFPACSSNRSGGDSDASIDAADTGDDIIFTNDSGPILLDPGLRWGLRAAYTGTHIMAGWMQDTADGDAMGLATLPIENPTGVVAATADPGFACEMYGISIVQPHSTGTGFVTIALGHQECDALLSWWSQDCEPTSDPYVHNGLYGDFPAVSVDEAPVDSQDRLVAGELQISEGTDEPGDESINFLIDRFDPGGMHERLLDATFEWSDLFATTGMIVPSSVLTGATFEEAGSLTVVAASERGVLVLAQATIGGEVTVPPEIAFDPNELHTPPVEHWSHRSTEYARAGDRFLAVVHQHYTGPWVSYGDERYSVVLGLDGEVLDGPHQLNGLEFADEDGWCSGVGLDWSGELYGHCYYDGAEGFRFVALDSSGLPASEPLLLMSYDYTHSNPFCDVVAVDADTFAVLMSLNGAADGFQPGLYLMFVDLGEPE